MANVSFPSALPTQFFSKYNLQAHDLVLVTTIGIYDVMSLSNLAARPS